MSETKKLIGLIDGMYKNWLKVKVKDPNAIDMKDVEMLKKIKEIVEGEPILRRLLWIRHGCSFPALYGDDGCMDCNACIIDFKNTPAKDIERRFHRISELRLRQETVEAINCKAGEEKE